MHDHVPNNTPKTGILPLPMPKSTWKAVAQKLTLTPQQTRIVELILRDLEDQEIADQLDLAVSTVRTHVTRIFVRTGATSRLNLVLRIFAVVCKQKK